jgi:mevalonate kinase
LGSSAAFSLCIASALLYTHSHISTPHIPVHHGDKDESKIHGGRRAIQLEDATLINAWAYVGEKILHGQPSGIDNTVATHGGAVAYTKGMDGSESNFETLQG